MIRWLTALFFSIAVHLGIFFGYSAFTLESNEPLKRKITNVNFLESEIDEKDEFRNKVIDEYGLGDLGRGEGDE